VAGGAAACSMRLSWMQLSGSGWLPRPVRRSTMCVLDSTAASGVVVGGGGATVRENWE